MIQIKRIYEEKAPEDGQRILVDRLWPRGMSKKRAQLDEWMKDIAPSPSLRQFYHQHREDFTAFKSAYERELAEDSEKQQALEELVQRARNGNVTLLYSSKNTATNNAKVLLEFLHAHYDV
ncbi:DUF488 family protein [Sporolactobacillus sp. Y61]|uniref:DUF488 family protein n=1 Tax=Sporolactobacillus sp. Y61 TaxID=3160863 RepID=A0AAU8IGD4_9BACL